MKYIQLIDVIQLGTEKISNNLKFIKNKTSKETAVAKSCLYSCWHQTQPTNKLRVCSTRIPARELLPFKNKLIS